MSENTPTISIIVPVHNGGDKFRHCLSSLGSLDPRPNEIIVVADGDTDGSWRLAQESGVKVLRTNSPGGPALARNLGAHSAKGEIFFFVDADVTVPPDAVGQISAVFQQDPCLAAVFGSYDDQPFETNFLSQYRNLLHHYVHQNSEKEASTFWGACGAIRRDVFFKMNGFDKKYSRPSIEDIDLGYRLKKGGCKIHLLKHIQVKHLKHWGILSLLKADFFYRALPWTDLILNEGHIINDLNLTHSSRMSVMAVFMLSLTFIGLMFTHWFLIPTVVLMVSLIGLNWDLYRFFRDKRSLGFAVKAIPLHWFYFFYSGFAFGIGYVKHQIKGLRLKN